MRITFILPFIKITGGVKAVMEYANNLMDMGHQVKVVYPTRLQVLPWGLNRLEFPIKKILHKRKYTWFSLKAELVRVPSLEERYIPRSDAIIATSWITAEWVNRYNPDKGRKFYLVQGHEVWDEDSLQRIRATYKMPLIKIVTSTYLKDLLFKEYGEKSYGPICCGVDTGFFNNTDKIYGRVRRIGMIYSRSGIKGFKDGLQAFEKARTRYPYLQLLLFGVDKPVNLFPEYVTFCYRPPAHQIRRIYCLCDVWVHPSVSEGWGLPPQEAMACKCAVVATNVGGIPDYTIPGEMALVSEPGRPMELAKNIIHLIESPELLRKISEAGWRHVQQFTWQSATRRFAEILVGMS